MSLSIPDLLHVTFTIKKKKRRLEKGNYKKLVKK